MVVFSTRLQASEMELVALFPTIYKGQLILFCFLFTVAELQYDTITKCYNAKHFTFDNPLLFREFSGNAKMK